MARSSHPSPPSKAASGWSTGCVSDAIFLTHVLEPAHPESPERLRAIRRLMDETGLVAKVTPLSDRVDPVEHILRLHSREHHESVMGCPTTGTVALEAVARVLGAVKAVAEGRVRNSFCAVRPPGHHAHNNGADFDGRCQGQGFCFYNNVAIAARYAQSVLGFRRILICDWDYHYGNGTAWFFRTDPTVFLFTTHNHCAYPGTGDPLYTGEGSGTGYTLNVHLDSGANDADIIEAWDTRLMPSLAELSFVPDLVLISAGFDSRQGDTLGCFAITDAGFVALTRRAMAIADQHCNGRLVSVLEGGYNVDGLARAVCGHVATLAGLDWREYAPIASRKRTAQVSSVTAPCVREGMLYLPPAQARHVKAIVVIDGAGREVHVVPQAELGKPVIDLWQQVKAAARHSVRIQMKDGTTADVTFGTGT
jgi:acetoin utilization deacetylase AcuC-like enzyme